MGLADARGVLPSAVGSCVSVTYRVGIGLSRCLAIGTQSDIGRGQMYYVTLFGPDGIMRNADDELLLDLEMDVFDWLESVSDFGWVMIGNEGHVLVYESPKNKGVLLMLFATDGRDL